MKSASAGPDREPAALIALVGPTASGKTGAGLALAEALGTEIVGVDSRQVYRGLDIGTAKPTPEQRRRVPHHLVDCADPDVRFSAGDFERAVLRLLPAFAGRPLLLVGGTGLYLRAVLQGICPTPPPSPAVRRWLDALAAARPEGLHALLRRVDPAAAERIHPHDRYRAGRALEVYLTCGEPLSLRQRLHREAGPPRRVALFGLEVPAAELKRRIAQRLEEMIGAGFVGEVSGLLAAGHDQSLPAFRAVGYPQFAAHVRGACTLADAAEATRRETWQYARRQLTWFRAQPGIRWIDAPAGRTEEALAAEILEHLRHGARVPA